ncbi:MAG: helicase C-terminal domain-containing protein [Candidatus Nanoarchaeia archaeon]|nr:helicase C-terminal domain-containing protein [Candidatus Nanoarchaeia archaeon]
MEINKIEDYIEDFKKSFLSEDFQWRKGQKEAIINIIETYYDKRYDTVILDAPVGSGKSIIAMCSAWILNRENKKGYILASDISLQEQYEKDFQKLKLNWGSVKGIDNYICIDNMEKASIGTCKIKDIYAGKMSCYTECPYYSARDHASTSQTSLLNYAYWLIHMNYVNLIMGEDKQIFKPRDFTFCDEAHKILDIIQNNYSPKFDNKTLEKIEKITNFFKTYKVFNHENQFIDLKNLIKELWEEENQDNLLSMLSKISKLLKEYLDSISKLKEKVKQDYPKGKPPREWREALYISNWLSDLEFKLSDYVQIIEETSSRNLVKNPQGEDLVFNCLKESYLMHRYFHRWTGFRVFMSATFADPTDYLLSLSLKNAKYIKVESCFDFSKSPIYFYNRRRMSQSTMQANLPWLYEKVNEIIDKHIGENGIIHSASYDLAMKIYEHLTPKNRKRVLVYNGTEEKRKVLETLKYEKSRVLIGPSLLEGLDLKNDWSRFQIFAKVPYLSLGDRFVKAKLAINPSWYRWKAIMSILQGTGRSVRNEKDWAITYILDGSLGDLIHNNRKAFPIEFMQRLQVISE